MSGKNAHTGRVLSMALTLALILTIAAAVPASADPIRVNWIKRCEYNSSTGYVEIELDRTISSDCVQVQIGGQVGTIWIWTGPTGYIIPPTGLTGTQPVKILMKQNSSNPWQWYDESSVIITDVQAPVISGANTINPDVVTITGTRFGSSMAGGDYVLFEHTQLAATVKLNDPKDFNDWGDTEIHVKTRVIPKAGKWKVTVYTKVNGVIKASNSVEVTIAVVINSVNPESDYRGKIITVLGDGFGNYRYKGAFVQLTWIEDKNGKVKGPSFQLDGPEHYATWTNERIDFRVPGWDGVPAGIYSLSVTLTGKGVSDTFEFTILDGPSYLPAATSRTWGTDSIGVSSPATNWYLAEGCTGPAYETWVLVQNPNNQPTDVKITYMTRSGRKDGPSETIPANSRKSYDVSKSVPDSWEVSTKVTSSKPVIVERAMYGDNRNWAHDSIGVSEPAQDWYLAEGSTAGSFDTWVLVQNPNDKPAKVEITYMTPDGAKAGPSETIGANSRKSYEVSDTVKDTWEVSTKVHSDLPVIAERAVYGAKGTGAGKWGTDSVGVSTPSTVWYLAEGCTAPEFETWVLVQNPNNTPVKVKLTYMTPAGSRNGPEDTIPANSRRSYDVSKTVPLEYSVSTSVTSESLPVVAERAVYWKNRLEAHDSIGTVTPAGTWYLAEGCTLSGFESWVLVQNTSSSPANVKFSYMTSHGVAPGPAETLAPNSRVTFNVACSVAGEAEVSTMVTSDQPVVVERAVYGDPK